MHAVCLENFGSEDQQNHKRTANRKQQCIKNDWSTDIFILEIGCRGFISNATSTFLTKL